MRMAMVEITVVNDLIPEIGTTATIDGERAVCATEVFTLTDTVEYKHLVPGKEYTVKGVLMDKATGEPFLQNGEQITSEVTFVPEAPSGSVEVLFTFDAKLIKTDTNIVVFEKLYSDSKRADCSRGYRGRRSDRNGHCPRNQNRGVHRRKERNHHRRRDHNRRYCDLSQPHPPARNMLSRERL